MTTVTSKHDAGRKPSSGKSPAETEKEKWLHAYRQMVSIRLFEEQVNEVYTRALMPGLAHLYSGEEGVAVGVCEALRVDDYITSTHRGHGHCLAKGASPDRMFAELLGKEAGYCRGKGGSMHIADPATGNLGANAIVGGSVGIATGAAFAAKTLGTDRAAVCDTYRYGGHHVGDINREYYRSKQEEHLWKTDRDPILVLANWLMVRGHADAASLDRIRDEVRAIMEAAVKFAIAAPYPSVDEVEKHVYA
jgi:TPP-dependent pyruvate/acetoin dehydrogenase alpha subunit